MKTNGSSYSSNIYVLSYMAVRNVQLETAFHEESALFKGESNFLNKFSKFAIPMT